MNAQSTQEILVFGATGGTGAAIVHAGLARGYRITAFVRDVERATRLFADKAAQINFHAGDATNADDIHKIISPKFAAVLSAMGVFQRKAGADDLTRGTEHILQTMNDRKIRRFVCVSSLGAGDSRGQGDLLTRIIQRTNLRHTLADKEMQEQAIMASRLDWTILRPSRLMNGNGPEHYTTWTGRQPKGKFIWQINRADVAQLAIDYIADENSIGKAFNVTGTKTQAV